MPITSLFEIGARILRRHARTLVAVAFLFQLPGAILDTIAQQRLAGSVSPLLVGLDTATPQVLAPTESQTSVILGALVLVVGAMLVSMILGAIATVAYATVVSRDYHSARTTLPDLIRLAMRRAVPAVAATVLASLAVLGVVALTTLLALACLRLLPTGVGEAGGIGVFLALVIGVGGVALVLTLLVRLCLATIAVAVEGMGPVAAIRHSWHLTGRNTWRTLAVLLLLAFILTVLTALLANLLGVAISDTIGARLGVGATLDATIGVTLAVLFAPVPVVVQTVLYFDLRVRRDGWDLPPIDVVEDGPSVG